MMHDTVVYVVVDDDDHHTNVVVVVVIHSIELLEYNHGSDEYRSTVRLVLLIQNGVINA